jgi:hypothetical protein
MVIILMKTCKKDKMINLEYLPPSKVDCRTEKQRENQNKEGIKTKLFNA